MQEGKTIYSHFILKFDSSIEFDEATLLQYCSLFDC